MPESFQISLYRPTDELGIGFWGILARSGNGTHFHINAMANGVVHYSIDGAQAARHVVLSSVNTATKHEHEIATFTIATP